MNACAIPNAITLRRAPAASRCVGEAIITYDLRIPAVTRTQRTFKPMQTARNWEGIYFWKAGVKAAEEINHVVEIFRNCRLGGAIRGGPVREYGRQSSGAAEPRSASAGVAGRAA